MCLVGYFELRIIIYNMESLVNKLSKKRMIWFGRDKIIRILFKILEKFEIKGIFVLKVVKN